MMAVLVTGPTDIQNSLSFYNYAIMTITSI